MVIRTSYHGQPNILFMSIPRRGIISLSAPTCSVASDRITSRCCPRRRVASIEHRLASLLSIDVFLRLLTLLLPLLQPLLLLLIQLPLARSQILQLIAWFLCYEFLLQLLCDRPENHLLSPRFLYCEVLVLLLQCLRAVVLDELGAVYNCNLPAVE
jgi:hypothetical protein